MADLYIGHNIDNYRIVRLLGKGGMGSVYLARDVTLQRDVALKIMHARFARQPGFRKRFLEEARAAARFKHSGIVEVYYFGDKTPLYIVMAYIPGDNLQKRLQDLRMKQQWIGLPEAVELVKHVGAALGYAHNHGILHRDIKPENILMKAWAETEPHPNNLTYQPIIADLGLAQLGGAAGEASGTPAYMSPEQALGNSVDARSDVYTLGILLYELAVGQVPFPAQNLQEAKEYHTQKRPPAPRTLRPDLPEGLEKVILQALQKDPAKRFPSAQALVQALAQLSPDSLKITAPPIEQAGAVPIMTKQASMAQARGESMMDEFPEFKPAGPGQDHIQISTPDRKTQQPVPIKGKNLTIGRGPDNDLVIDDEKASRHHAVIEFDGKDYKVKDLDSKNGTYIGDVKLLSSVPDVWRPNKPLRIGGHSFRLISRQTATAINSQLDPNLQPSNRNSVRPPVQPVTNDVQLYIQPTEIKVVPGERAQIEVTLINNTNQVAHYRVNLRGIPPEWVVITPNDDIMLMDNGEAKAAVLIQPPMSTSTKAGRFRITVEAVQSDVPDHVYKANARLVIGAIVQFTIEMRQNKAKVGEMLRIVVRNNSNKSEKFILSCWDDANQLKFSIPHKAIDVPAGTRGALDFTAQPQRRRWIGGPMDHAFKAKVAIKDGKEESQGGTFTSRGLIPPWVPPVVIGIVAVAVGIWGLVYRNHQIGIANQTATAIAVAQVATVQQLSTQTAITATISAQATANAQATLAAQATADARATKEAEIALTATSEFIKTATAEAMTAANAAAATANAATATEAARQASAAQTAEAGIAAEKTRVAREAELGAAAAAAAAATQAAAADKETATSIAADATGTAEIKEQTATAEAKLTAEAEKAERDADKTQQAADRAAMVGTQEALIAIIKAQSVTPPPGYGGMRIAEYCRNAGFADQFLDGNTPYSWGCVMADNRRSNFLTDANYTDLCHQQYGAGSIAGNTDRSDPFHWVCTIP